MLCKNEAFHRWVERKRNLIDNCVSTDQAAAWMRWACGIESRAELDHNEQAAVMFYKIARRFQGDIKS
jgi:hypothetical protein